MIQEVPCVEEAEPPPTPEEAVSSAHVPAAHPEEPQEQAQEEEAPEEAEEAPPAPKPKARAPIPSESNIPP